MNALSQAPYTEEALTKAIDAYLAGNVFWQELSTDSPSALLAAAVREVSGRAFRARLPTQDEVSRATGIPCAVLSAFNEVADRLPHDEALGWAVQFLHAVAGHDLSSVWPELSARIAHEIAVPIIESAGVRSGEGRPRISADIVSAEQRLHAILVDWRENGFPDDGVRDRLTFTLRREAAVCAIRGIGAFTHRLADEGAALMISYCAAACGYQGAVDDLDELCARARRIDGDEMGAISPEALRRALVLPRRFVFGRRLMLGDGLSGCTEGVTGVMRRIRDMLCEEIARASKG